MKSPYRISRQQREPSSSPRYYISTKSGFRPYKPQPGVEVPFAVMHRGRWCLVHRAQTDAEYFNARPEAAWRMTTCHKPWHARDYYEYRITTRDGTLESMGDRWDVEAKLSRAWSEAETNLGRFGSDSPLQRMRRAVEHLLADLNRTFRVRAA